RSPLRMNVNADREACAGSLAHASRQARARLRWVGIGSMPRMVVRPSTSVTPRTSRSPIAPLPCAIDAGASLSVDAGVPHVGEQLVEDVPRWDGTGIRDIEGIALRAEGEA